MHKAFILGAGLGTRLQPLTHSLPKPLVPVFHRPLVTYALDHCMACGINTFAINTHHIPDAWDQTFPEASYKNCPISFFHEPILLETGGGLKNIAPFFSDEPVLVYNGDILTNIDIQHLIDHHTRSGNTVTLAMRSTGDKCNIALEGDRVIDLRHERGIHPGTHQFTGIYCIQPELLDLIPANEKISVIPAFLALAEQGKIGACVLDDGYWLDLGTRQSYLDVHQMTGIAPSIHPDARISPEAKISNSVIGPDCIVEAGAELDHCIMWPETHAFSDARLSECILYTSNPTAGVHHSADL